MKLSILLSCLALTLSAHAQSAPKVIFFGDGYTAAWPLPAGSNWINEGVAGFNLDGLTSYGAAAAFQSDVVSQHPAIVHIMVGANNLSGDESWQYDIPSYIRDIDTMVDQAKAANIKVILGNITPNVGGWGEPITAMNAALAAYGAANDIQVINYYDALCGCVSSTGSGPMVVGGVYVNGLLEPGPGSNPVFDAGLLPTAAGYALMTQMAQTAIANLTATLNSGWLQDETLTSPNYFQTYSNVNTVSSGQSLQFTPIGLYSDGSQQPQLNTSYSGSSGTWSSSNPLVMYVNRSGKASALTPGTAIIKYTSRNGIHFSEWVMYVQQDAAE